MVLPDEKNNGDQHTLFSTLLNHDLFIWVYFYQLLALNKIIIYSWNKGCVTIIDKSGRVPVASSTPWHTTTSYFHVSHQMGVASYKFYGTKYASIVFQ